MVMRPFLYSGVDCGKLASDFVGDLGRGVALAATLDVVGSDGTFGDDFGHGRLESSCAMSASPSQSSIILAVRNIAIGIDHILAVVLGGTAVGWLEDGVVVADVGRTGESRDRRSVRLRGRR